MQCAGDSGGEHAVAGVQGITVRVEMWKHSREPALEYHEETLEHESDDVAPLPKHFIPHRIPFKLLKAG